MSARKQFLTAAVESFASGAAAALVFNGGYWLATRDFPSLITSLIASQIVTWVWGGAQAYRLNRQWQRVLASYNLPALGEGIEIPHRPPASGPEYLGHIVDYAADGGAPECVEDCPGCKGGEES